MSLFPAYNETDQKSEVPANDGEATPINWLENRSYNINPDLLERNQINFGDNREQSAIACESSDDEENADEKPNRKDFNLETALHLPFKFSGNEDFYVDKTKIKQYNNIDTLKKPACPIYHVRHHMPFYKYRKTKLVERSVDRYYRSKQIRKYRLNNNEGIHENALNSDEYSIQMKLLNRKTMECCTDLKAWLDIIQLQDKNPYKWSHLCVAEKKIDYIHRALHYVPKNHKLYSAFIEIVNAIYPSHDATKMLESLLKKDPYCFLLWQSLIITTQCTMATCNVPEVLDLYEKCMIKMHSNLHSDKQIPLRSTDDAVMLQLFYSLALFLRQAALYERFFAMVILALELNVPNSTQICQGLDMEPQVESVLLEYEELILKSGLPMSEIWLRIEKLRSGFIFLPFGGDESNCSDPQRIVSNEDICKYVYPLKSRENAYHLLLIILKLLKMPFIETDCLAEQFYEESDAVEEILVIFLNNRGIHLQFSNETVTNNFRQSIYELAKDLSINPTFFINSIAKDIYTQCLRNFVLNCAAAYENIDERKRLSFLVLWCRFERILLILHKLGNKLTADYIKEGRNRFKDLMKRKTNRNLLYLYSELALYELESNSNREAVEKIFTNLISAYEDEQSLASEMCAVYVTYAEVLINWGEINQASIILSAYVLGLKLEKNPSISSSQKLTAVKALHDKLQSTIKIEENVEIMLLEQHILPDYTVSLLKAYILLQYTINQKREALLYLDELLTVFKKDSANVRHRYLREKVFEIYAFMLNIFDGRNHVANTTTHSQKQIYDALQEYPRNVYLLQTWSTLDAMPWYKLRGGFLKLKITMTSIVFLIAIAHYRYLKNITSLSSHCDDNTIVDDVEYKKSVIRQRLLNLFGDILQSVNASAQSSLYTVKSNPLFWRCYLRCLSDRKTSFENSKKCLLSALDECSWSKALYLDGATYVPQDYCHLMDLIIEKQLRIYSIPEELEILRENA